MTREELISYCRYYKGEEDEPKNVLVSFWNYERVWVMMMQKQKEFINQYLDEYRLAGLADFRREDKTPISLKAVLYNRYAHNAAPYISKADFEKYYDNYCKR